MKIKDGYLLRQMADTFVAVPTGRAALDFSGVITLNRVGAFLWKNMEKKTEEQALLDALLAEYEVDEKKAKADLEAFLQKLRMADLIE